MNEKHENTQPIEPEAQFRGKTVVAQGALMLCRELLKSLGQSVRLVALYHSAHPVPSVALQDSWLLVQRIFRDVSWQELTLALADGRWVVNGTVLVEASHAGETLSGAFRVHGLHAVTLSRGVLLYELGVFAELAAASARRDSDFDANEFLERKGVKRVKVNAERYTRARGAAAAPKAAAPVLVPESGAGFGRLVKSLVEQSVKDPQERGRVYTDMLKVVRQALERKVGEATGKLRGEKALVTQERDRTEKVLASVAHGKVIVDREGKVLMMDPIAEEIVGKRLREAAGQPLMADPAARDRLVVMTSDLALSAGKTPTGTVHVCGDAEVHQTLAQSMAMVVDEEGRAVGTCSVLPYAAKYQEAMRLQEEFLAHVTHELKAPLASLCSALELVDELADAKLTEQERRFLAIGRRNSSKLRQMVDEILDFSKIQSGEITVRPVPVRVGPVLSEAVEGMRPWAAAKKLTLALPVESEAAKAVVLADHARVVQVLTNLISNAVKATPEGGQIWVTAFQGEGRRAGSVVFSVKDTGCGIAKDAQEKIFEKFASAAGKGRREGVGLGLAIVRELVRQHRGELWLKSTPGRGAAFCFSLPNAAPGREDIDGR